MVRTLKGKVIVRAIIIITLLAIALDMAINKILIKNLEDTIVKEMNYARTVTVDNINNYNKLKELSKAEEDSWKVLNSTSNLFKMYTALASKEELINYSGKIVNLEEIYKIIKSSQGIKSILNLNYNRGALEVTYCYPVYIDEYLYGVLIFQRDYNELYKNNRSLMVMITLIEIVMFISLIILIYIVVGRATKPLSYLSQAMKEVAEGNYDVEISLSTGDEIEALGKSFNFMKSKIEDQFNYINAEKHKVEKLEKSTREFFNNATHEMKTPITAISGYVQLLREKGLEEAVSNRAMDRIAIESHRMDKLVCNLLDLSRGRLQIKKEREYFSLSEVLDKAIDELSIKAYKKGIKFKKQISTLNAYGVKEEIKQVINNMLDNAIKYSAGDYIKVTGYEDKDFSILEFSNPCKALPEDIKHKLLEPFVKYNYNDASISSSGLGLYICRNIIEENFGEITYVVEKECITFTIKFSQNHPFYKETRINL
ncbi:sensor histidine kinase [Desnuesiella massiliensis]|uniref:sensor histidine kinase n=1 Tax=Desnuesiella massiliensis TaxID=1650662 RepID=UPI0006E337CA|nr:HAMP domain-containing sensor histidine kinase [Desnuesiella massiliensis]